MAKKLIVISKNSRGVIEIPAIMIFALIITTIGLGLLGGRFIENIMSFTSVQSQKNFYLSESGIQDGLLKITRNKDATSGGYTPPIVTGDETLDVSISAISEDSTKTITSSASDGKRYRDIQETILVDEDGKVTFSNWQETAE